jgi:hypothetical protein
MFVKSFQLSSKTRILLVLISFLKKVIAKTYNNVVTCTKSCCNSCKVMNLDHRLVPKITDSLEYQTGTQSILTTKMGTQLVHGNSALDIRPNLGISARAEFPAFRPFNPYSTLIYTHNRVLIIRFEILTKF